VPHTLATCTRLQSFTVISQIDMDNINGYDPDKIRLYRDEMLGIIHASYGLQRLTIFADLLCDLRLGLVEYLVELNIWHCRERDVQELERLLPQCVALRRLGLVELSNFPAAVKILQDHKHHLGQLTALKLMSLDAVEPTRSVVGLADVIGYLTHLDRFVCFELDTVQLVC
jgi:hypothetical protein